MGVLRVGGLEMYTAVCTLDDSTHENLLNKYDMSDRGQPSLIRSWEVLGSVLSEVCLDNSLLTTQILTSDFK
jgi:hypothetical protein